MFDEVMCVKGDEKREKNKVVRRMGRWEDREVMPTINMHEG